MNLKLAILTVLIFTASAVSAQQIGEGYAPAIIQNFSSPLKSGIYNGLNSTTIGMAPDNSNVWQHLFVARHIGTYNNYQLQIASSFAVNDRLFFRKIVAGDLSAPITSWYELATRSSNKFEGDQVIIGSLGIGTTTTGTHKLAVEGSIAAREIKVLASGWADFVFKKEYDLPKLEEVEKHINEKGHLENIPSEDEVLKNGINLGEMNAKLLQKIEELTLYMIQHNKQITDLQNRLEKVESSPK